MPVILDTDHMTLLEHESRPQIDRLEARLAALPAQDIAVTIVSFQEQVKGWLAFLNRATTDEKLLRGYARLTRLLLEAAGVVAEERDDDER